jgi:hypothetical protein
MILTEKHLTALRRDCLLFDLSTKHYGYDEDAVSKLGFKMVHCSNIAEYTAPKSAGYMIGGLAASYLN